MKEPDNKQPAGKPAKTRSRLAVIISDLKGIYSLDNKRSENILVRLVKKIFNKTFKFTGE